MHTRDALKNDEDFYAAAVLTADQVSAISGWQP
jgi:hypothetical protein